MNSEAFPKTLLEIQNFGPIRAGKIELAPLTVFIGPNGSGKTYAATLFYTLARTVVDTVFLGMVVQTLDVPPRLKGINEPIIIPDMLSRKKQQQFRALLNKWRERVRRQIETSLPSYFGRESVESLVRLGGSSFRIALLWEREEAPFILAGNWSRHREWQWELMGFEETRWIFHHPPRSLADFFTALSNVFGFSQIYYLPAARAGLIQGWRALAGMAIRLVRREFGLRPIEVSTYSGVTGDFLLMLVEDSPLTPLRFRKERVEEDWEKAIALLEKDILQGYVDWSSPEDSQLLFFQKRGDGELSIPLTAISSGSAELAPLDLLLRRRLLGPGDWLIVEEPEAHLHPENQRRIATLMVRLVRAGVRVLCTTHSDLILHQISNHLLLGEVLQKGQYPRGVDLDPESDRLGYDEVGVYLFRMEDGGSVIEKIQPQPGFGIPEDEFLRVAESIGTQTYRLVDATETP